MESLSVPKTSQRRYTYYWKSDRPATFHGVLRNPDPRKDEAIRSHLLPFLQDALSMRGQIDQASGEGSHRTFLFRNAQRTYFVRVEDGPECDGHLAMETAVMAAVSRSGISVPQVIFCDVSRLRIPFAVQVITYYDHPDLNRLCRETDLQPSVFAEEIGSAIATWQEMPVKGFGPFERVDTNGTFAGFHNSYASYFHLHLDRHLYLLRTSQFLADEEAARIRRLVDDHSALLALSQGCLVHKDIALWNILGTPDGITAYIDWDDAISGDPTDDLSLLACFFSSGFLQSALQGYERVRPLPANFLERFWLHMLRNIVVKAVIRSGAGYFDQTRGNFLLGAGEDGTALWKFTKAKLLNAQRGLLENRPISDL